MAGRETVALLLVAVTTFGWGGDYATRSIETSVSRPATVRTETVAHSSKPDVIFSLRDALDALRYELGFESDVRNANTVTNACRDVTVLAPQLDSTPMAEAVATSIAFCKEPTRASETQAAVVVDDALRYREMSFDIAA